MSSRELNVPGNRTVTVVRFFDSLNNEVSLSVFVGCVLRLPPPAKVFFHQLIVAWQADSQSRPPHCQTPSVWPQTHFLSCTFGGGPRGVWPCAAWGTTCSWPSCRTAHSAPHHQCCACLRYAAKKDICENSVQWGSEYLAILVFEWLKRGQMSNGLVFV